jgi:hypothetical protein
VIENGLREGSGLGDVGVDFGIGSADWAHDLLLISWTIV